MDPVSALVLCFWAAWYFVRDGIDGVTSAKGNVPHGAMNRHAERMKRLDQEHEKWMARSAERRALRDQGHSTIGRALQNRVAKWLENAGRRVNNADAALRAAEENDVRVGRTPGRWRAAWRRARRDASRMWRAAARRAERRLNRRFDEERPFVPPVGDVPTAPKGVPPVDESQGAGQPRSTPNADRDTPADPQHPTVNDGDRHQPPRFDVPPRSEEPPRVIRVTAEVIRPDAPKLPDPLALPAVSSTDADVVDAEVVQETTNAPQSGGEPLASVTRIHSNPQGVLMSEAGSEGGLGPSIGYANRMIAMAQEAITSTETTANSLEGEDWSGDAVDGFKGAQDNFNSALGDLQRALASLEAAEAVADAYDANQQAGIKESVTNR